MSLADIVRAAQSASAQAPSNANIQEQVTSANMQAPTQVPPVQVLSNQVLVASPSIQDIQSVLVTSTKSMQAKSTSAKILNPSALGATVLAVRENISPEDLKHVPTSHEYFDGTGFLELIALGISEKIPVLIEGDTGVGKTSAIRYLASKCQAPYRRLNLNGSTTVDEFVGKVMLDKDGTYWTDGVLIDAMRKGHWIVLDEINAALPEILFVLHSLLDDDGYVVLAEKDGEVVRPHENFRVFATMNPTDSGYAGTKNLNQAFLDRFMVLHADFPSASQEMKMVKSRFPSRSYVTDDIVKNMIKYAGEMRVAYKSGAQEFLLSPRGILQWVHLAEKIQDVHKSAEIAIVNKAPYEEREGIRDMLKLRFGLGIYDYKDQCSDNKVYAKGDRLVVVLNAIDTGFDHLKSEYIGMYEVTEVYQPDSDANMYKDPKRYGYEVKCLAKNQKDDALKDVRHARLGNMRTAQYHGANL